MAGSHLVTMRGGRLRAAAGAAALALLAVLAWQAGAALRAAPASVRADVAEAVMATPTRLRASADARTDVVPARAASAGAGEHVDGLRALLRRPPAGLRDSVLRAQASPGDGGRLYARYLLRQCAAADSVAGLHAPEGDDPGRTVTSDPSDPRVARAVARVQQLRAACQQFTPAELSAGTNVVSNDAHDADPLLGEADRFDATPARILRVLAHPDPLLLQEIGPRLLQAGAGGQDDWFDGRRIDPGLAEPALALLPCALGLPCDETDPQVWTACLQGLGCVDSREELVLRRAAPDDAARRQRILRLAERIGEAVRAADASRFAPAQSGSN